MDKLSSHLTYRFVQRAFEVSFFLNITQCCKEAGPEVLRSRLERFHQLAIFSLAGLASANPGYSYYFIVIILSILSEHPHFKCCYPNKLNTVGQG